MKEEVLYLCDPEKNTDCPKTHCAYHWPHSWPSCIATIYSDRAKTDENGEPIPEPLWANRPNLWLRPLGEALDEQCPDDTGERAGEKARQEVGKMIFEEIDTGRRFVGEISETIIGQREKKATGRISIQFDEPECRQTARIRFAQACRALMHRLTAIIGKLMQKF